MKKFFGIKYITAAALFLATLIASCKKDTNNYSSTNSTTTTSYGGGGADTSINPFPVTQVNIINYHFSPMNVSTLKGASVSWTNRDSVSHTVTSTIGAFDSGDLAPGKNYFIPFPHTGVYQYFCKYHKENGKITIQ